MIPGGAMPTSRNPPLGILLMIAAVAAFAAQDGFSKGLAQDYNTLMVVMIRYWAFAGFVVVLALRRPQGLRAAVATGNLVWHILRGALLVTEICLIVWGYTLIGLIDSMALFAVCPLLVAALSGPVLGERIGWQRWAAVGMGLAGVIVMLRPGAGVFGWAALLPLGSALLFAIYSVLTRLTTRDERSFPAFFWPAIAGAALMTVIGLPNLQPIAPTDLPALAAYSAIAILANWLMLRAYEQAEAARLQPYAYLQIVFATGIGIAVYGERLTAPVALGTAIVVAAGLLALAQERVRP
ncbi:MAG: DMT family transporter [Fuscovulum sp.]|nr:DMT family transporter [Fuscovulum sp.]